MPDQPYPIDFDAPKPKPAPLPPMACLLRIHDTLCLRTPGDNEYTFRDADYAMAHYADGKGVIRICSACKLLFTKQKAQALENSSR
jgi:hypothetical protein